MSLNSGVGRRKALLILILIWAIKRRCIYVRAFKIDGARINRSARAGLTVEMAIIETAGH